MKSNVIQFPLSVEFDDKILSDLYKIENFLRKVLTDTKDKDYFLIQAIYAAIDILTDEITTYIKMMED